MDNKVDDDRFIHTASITTDEMKKLLTSLNSNKSPGTDELHPRLLKECASSLALPLKLLFDKTIA